MLFHTVDGGQTWQSVTVPAFGSIHFVDAGDGWLMTGKNVLLSGQEEDIYRTTDGGKTWTKVASTSADDESSGLPFSGSKNGFTFATLTTGWITGTHDWWTHSQDEVSHKTYLYVTHDGGRTWRSQDLPPLPLTVPYHAWSPTIEFFTPQDGILSRLYSVPDNVHPVASGVVFYVTHNGGTTWTPTVPPYAASPTSSSDNSHVLGPLSFSDANHGWVMTDDGTLYVTSDSGLHWTTIRLSLAPSGDRGPVGQIDFISPQVGWAVGRPHFLSFLLKTVDGGHTWTPLSYTISR